MHAPSWHLWTVQLKGSRSGACVPKTLRCISTVHDLPVALVSEWLFFRLHARAAAQGRGLTKVVGADLQGLLLAHEQPDLPVVLALQQSDLPCAPLLPLPRLVVKAVQLALPACTCQLAVSGRACSLTYEHAAATRAECCHKVLLPHWGMSPQPFCMRRQKAGERNRQSLTCGRAAAT